MQLKGILFYTSNDHRECSITLYAHREPLDAKAGVSDKMAMCRSMWFAECREYLWASSYYGKHCCIASETLDALLSRLCHTVSCSEMAEIPQLQ